jgi:hypothetical protein
LDELKLLEWTLKKQRPEFFRPHATRLNMPRIEISEEQIVESLDQLSPQARRDALLRLLPAAHYLDQAIDRNRPKIEALARARGLEWNSLTEEQREALVDEILHE